MKHLLIKKRRNKIVVLFILVILGFVAILPLVYKNIFMYEEDFITEYETCRVYDFFGKSTDSDINKGVSFDLQFLEGGYVFSKVNIEDLDIRVGIISADVIIKGRFIKDEKESNIGFEGKLFSNNVSFNNLEGFGEVGSSFEIKRDKLVIKSLRFGKSYNLTGWVKLLEPYETKLQLEIKRADIKDMAILAKAKNPELLMGTINGVFNLKGNLANLHSDGIVMSRNGKVGPVAYDSATLRFKGFGPIINIVDSVVKQGKKTTLTMEGYIDLRNIAKGNLLDGIKVKADLVTVAWKGWDITKSGQDELRMTKDINDNMRVSFRTKTREGFTSYYNEENPEEMSLEYKIGTENLKMKFKENEEFFGIEHKIEF